MNAKLHLQSVRAACQFLLAALLLTLPGQSAFAQEKNTAVTSTGTQKANPGATKTLAAQQTQARETPIPSSKAEGREAQNKATENTAVQENPSGDGSHEGIKVHGHWTIEVRNPDGSLAARRVFENAYSPSSFLANLLAREASVGFWFVGLNGSVSAPGPCGGGACQIYETGYPLSTPLPPFAFQGLTVSATANTLVLAGSMTAPSTGTIGIVFTSDLPCPSSTLPSTPCTITPLSPQTLTGTTLTPGSSTPPISVSQGQIVSVTVVISFS
jgi:hypothetical protein